MTRRAERPSIDLDGEWRFIPDLQREYAADRLPNGVPIRVPGCWEAQVPAPYGIITAWYRRPMDVPEGWRGDRVVIRFGAVMYQCAVYLNGRQVGDHEGGFLPFEVALQDAVRWDGPNELAVRIVNPVNAIAAYPAFSDDVVSRAQELEPDLPLTEVPHGKQTWYSSTSGIWQSVRLERRPAVALAPLHVRPDLPGEAATVRWALDGLERPVRSEGAPDALELRLIDPAGTEVRREHLALTGGPSRGEVRFAVPSPIAWDIDQPNLYRIEATLLRDEEPLDTLDARFGMRSIETRDGRILLNGRPIYLLGALDQDFYADGISTPPDREYLDRQMRLAREMGLNLLRCHIKVPDPAYLDAADEAGILVWSELPNWSRFTTAAATRGRETLRQMVDTLGNHPSIVIWTIINEDWGTELRDERRDRRWLLDTSRWLKDLDPTRLVVDNSACDTPTVPNFHLATDLSDFHVYYLPPDNAIRWRNRIEEFARRPSWLFSPHGDASTRGNEPLVLSEFGSWGLPRIDRLFAHYGREPWWFETGHEHYRPMGVQQRFSDYGLDRIWGSVDELAEATQWHQFEGLQYEIGQLRRHDSIQGYVITELTDLYWEANGLLDIARGTKAYHDRLRDLNAPDVVVPDLARRDVFGGDRLEADVHLSSYGEDGDGGRIAWALQVPGSPSVSGELPVADWPAGGARRVGSIAFDVPQVAATSDGSLVVRALARDGGERARDEVRLAILPAAARRTAAPLEVAVHDPLDIWGVARRVEDLGHPIVRDDARLLIATELTDGPREHVEGGGRALILARAGDAIPDGHDLARPVAVHPRQRPHSDWPGQRSPWDGNWITSWSWILHDDASGLPRRNPLDFAYEEVMPDHVLLGSEPGRDRGEVRAGMFVGWVHAPAALIWTFPQGRGQVTVTTFRVAPESGPLATVLLEDLIQRAAGGDPTPARVGGHGAGAGARPAR